MRPVLRFFIPSHTERTCYALKKVLDESVTAAEGTTKVCSCRMNIRADDSLEVKKGREGRREEIGSRRKKRRPFPLSVLFLHFDKNDTKSRR